MPKQKTHSGAKKRFKVTGTGKMLRRHAMKSHLLEKKPSKRKRSFRKDEPSSRQRRASRSRNCWGGANAAGQAIRPRAQEAPQGPRAGEGVLGAQALELPLAKEQVEHSLVYAYRDRKNRKRTMRALWIIRINAAARQNGLSYNQFMTGMRKAEIELDRKVLADLAVSDPPAFGAVAEQAKAALEKA